MKRSAIREQVFKLLFRAEFVAPEEMPEQEQLFFDSGDMTVSAKDRAAIVEKTQKVMEKTPEIDKLIGEKMEGWQIGRVGKAELAILRLGIYEMLYDDQVPEGVAINEAVQLASRFGQDKAGAFVNGVLARFATEKKEAGKPKAD